MRQIQILDCESTLCWCTFHVLPSRTEDDVGTLQETTFSLQQSFCPVTLTGADESVPSACCSYLGAISGHARRTLAYRCTRTCYMSQMVVCGT